MMFVFICSVCNVGGGGGTAMLKKRDVKLT